MNCTKMAGDRPGQPAYEIFGIEHRFQQSKSKLSRFKEADAGGRQRWLALNKVVILPQLSCVA